MNGVEFRAIDRYFNDKNYPRKPLQPNVTMAPAIREWTQNTAIHAK